MQSIYDVRIEKDTAPVIEEIEIDYCPIWSTDELTNFQELGVAASGYKADQELALADVNFFDFLDERVYNQHFDSGYHPAGTLFKEHRPEEFGGSRYNPFETAEEKSKDWWARKTVLPHQGQHNESIQQVNGQVRGFARTHKLNYRSPTNHLAEPTSPTAMGVKRREAEKKRSKKRKRDDHHSGPKQEKKRKRVASADGQTTCCLKNCEMGVTNRLRFSLRCTTDDDFKADFISRGWDRVCHKCYFSCLYKYKKQNRPKNSDDKKKKKKKAKSQ